MAHGRTELLKADSMGAAAPNFFHLLNIVLFSRNSSDLQVQTARMLREENRPLIFLCLGLFIMEPLLSVKAFNEISFKSCFKERNTSMLLNMALLLQVIFSPFNLEGLF